MKYLVNGTLRSDRTREELLERVKKKSLSRTAWTLIEKGVIKHEARSRDLAADAEARHRYLGV